MSKKSNFLMVLVAVMTDLFVAYAWYVALFPTEPITIFEATLGGAMMMFTSLLMLGMNILIFSIALAEDS